MKSNNTVSLKRLAVMAITLGLVAGCSNIKPHEKSAQEKAQAAGLEVVDKSRFDGTFVVQGADFSQYKKVLIGPLDLDEVEIRQPPSSGSLRTTPWELNDEDKRFFQERYTEALINNLVADGAYTTAIDSGPDVLAIKARVLQIAPVASKDDFKGRPLPVKVYSEGAGTMTIEISLYDSNTSKLLAIITDQRDLGRVWQENNRVNNSLQVRLAFNQWLNNLRVELERLSKK